LLEIWRAAAQARADGVDVRAVTVWSLLGSFDWNSLVCESRDYYEPGAFDIRSPVPRPTALAALTSQLAAGVPPSHPVLQREGWWRRPDRFTCSPVTGKAAVAPLRLYRPHIAPEKRTPILISGAHGTLGRAFAAVCTRRNLAFRLLDRDAMDIANRSSVDAVLERWKPWAVINASGYVDIDDAEADAARCFRENATGPEVLAARCAARDVALLTFSSDQVFDGTHAVPRVESDPVRPLNVYGRSKAAAEALVGAAHPGAMVVRTSAFFGPWDDRNFVVHALTAMARGEPFAAADDVRVSPTYVPDLADTCLDLLIDGEAGVRHLANEGDVSWAELAMQAAECADISSRSLVAEATPSNFQTATRPLYSVLGSERARLMPTLGHALARFVAARPDLGARAATPRIAAQR